MLASALLAACAAAAASLASAQLPNPATRVYLSDASLAAGARALDGSRGVYYVARGAETAKFVIWQRGGGWCTSNENCAERALTMLGSSAEAFCPPSVDLTTYDESENFKQLSNNASVNPQAWNWTKIFLPYLDGGSQTGDRTDAVPAGGNRSIFYRGARLHRWTVAALLADEGLSRATDVLLGGGSAGALATFLHADSWRDALPPSAKLVAVPDSGFFLNYNSTTDANVAYGASMRWVFSAMNSSGGLPAACVAAHAADPALCMFAENVAPTLRTPTFALQSTYDLYQIPSIAGLKPNDTEQINQYGDLLAARLEAQFLNSSAVNHGVFLDSCYHHVGEWREIVIDGIDNAQALMAFYDSVGKPGRKVWKQGRPYPCAACCARGQ